MKKEMKGISLAEVVIMIVISTILLAMAFISLGSRANEMREQDVSQIIETFSSNNKEIRTAIDYDQKIEAIESNLLRVLEDPWADHEDIPYLYKPQINKVVKGLCDYLLSGSLIEDPNNSKYCTSFDTLLNN